ncbi:MAG: aryl-sulfate sulfotransferase [Clostridiaceae bacterium]|nr:aryl-sulfate sulfotransferase [Clostridiaceae bacterium]
MKGKMKVIIIILVLLLVGTGVFLWKMNQISTQLSEQEQERLAEERDLVEEQDGKEIDQINSVDIIPLYLKGADKNVVTTDFKNVKEIYSEKKSSEVEENLTAIKKNKSFSLQEPLWAYNPYGTNRDSMYVYFTTSGNCYCRYTVSVKDEDIPDFTRTAAIETAGGVTKTHEYQIIGLVPGETNYITLHMYNSDDELSAKQTFSVDVPSSKAGAQQKLQTEDGRSKTTISNGLYAVFEKKKAILLYDNSGILRGEIPTIDNFGMNMEQVYDTLLFASGKGQLSQVNALGQVTKTIATSGYTQAGEFCYDGGGNVYVIATANQKGAAPASKIIKVELETGEVSQMLDMDTLLSKVYKKAVKKAKKSTVNWVELNSVQVVGANSLLISSKKLSSIFKVSNVGSLLPKINYIIADKKIYQSYKSLKKKVLTKVSGDEQEEAAPTSESILETAQETEAFASQYGQEALCYQAASEEGQYDLSLLNNNAGTGEKGSKKSYYYQYRVDETAKTYQLTKKLAFDQTKKHGNILEQEESYIYCNSDKKAFSEVDDTGKLMKQFKANAAVYRVTKSDFKGFWFQ